LLITDADELIRILWFCIDLFNVFSSIYKSRERKDEISMNLRHTINDSPMIEGDHRNTHGNGSPSSAGPLKSSLANHFKTADENMGVAYYRYYNDANCQGNVTNISGFQQSQCISISNNGLQYAKYYCDEEYFVTENYASADCSPDSMFASSFLALGCQTYTATSSAFLDCGSDINSIIPTTEEYTTALNYNSNDFPDCPDDYEDYASFVSYNNDNCFSSEESYYRYKCDGIEPLKLNYSDAACTIFQSSVSLADTCLTSSEYYDVIYEYRCLDGSAIVVNSSGNDDKLSDGIIAMIVILSFFGFVGLFAATVYFWWTMKLSALQPKSSDPHTYGSVQSAPVPVDGKQDAAIAELVNPSGSAVAVVVTDT
jgi:hypothetical protein